MNIQGGDQLQLQVKRAVKAVIPLILSHTEDDGCCPVDIKLLKAAAGVNVYAFNEAMGQLKAIGFLSERKAFRKAILESRADGSKYYYAVNKDRLPEALMPDDINAALSKRERRLSRARAEEAEITRMMFEEISRVTKE